ncbi:acyltransferase family protein [Mesorhizobium loti]|uniref:Acetyl transferase, NolL n=1 Tax=Rhizobium loti TaxID=381 RepID=M5AM61_RHILI|nr:MULTISPECIES: nodulation factor fucose acetyltransferase NolL [Mesorhizobium]ANN60718.1 nodulation protein NolL [Mesorhizobium loti NZP2037]OBP78008.1 nodulation protein NolL [Mesorhizobium loti]OBP81272.1 nodulation protein NolL [Mesorhizobium loti]OBP88400.1 nodulation protein NolL [Mesorhizobium loti]OBQ69359.1 nodulation protein NolL [Mesorhizobium loti]
MLDHITVGAKGRGLHPAETNNRNLSFDFAKGILITLVVVGHLLQYCIYRGTEAFWLSPYFKSIYIFHMPLFMAISGYLSSGAIFRKSFNQGIGDRATQLLLPMLFWCVLIWALKSAVSFPTESFTKGLLDLSTEVVGTYWFIWAAFISFFLIRLLTTFSRLSIWIIGLSAIVVALAPVTFSITPLLRYTYPFYCLGFLCAQSAGWQNSIIWRNKSISLGLLSISAFICFLWWGKDTYAYNNLVLIEDGKSFKQVFLMFAGSAAASAVAMQFMFQCWRLVYSTRMAHFVAVELGQSTLLLYLVQGAVFRLMDLINFGDVWDLTTRIAFASAVGVAIVVIAMAIRRVTRDLGYVSRIVVGAPPRPSLPKSQSVTNLAT